MNILILGSLIALAVLGIGLLLMALVVRFSRAVVDNQAEIDRLAKEKKTVNPQATGGYPIAATAPIGKQVQQALQLAAKRAAALPRGANVDIQRAGLTDAHANKKYASRGVTSDPLTAVKIAQFHTWKGLTYTPPSAAPARPAAPAGRPVAAPSPATAPAVTLIEITDAMSPAEKRKAIIANAKAQAAAAKGAKGAGGAEAAPIAAEVAPLGASPARTPVVAAPPAGIAPPDLIAVTDAMSPAEKRKAIIANAKAQSAYNKALKAAGYDAGMESSALSIESAEPTPEPEPAPAVAVSNAPPPPALTTITPDMAPAAIRQARINNAKALSAYRKQLKELGIDPQSVVIEEP